MNLFIRSIERRLSAFAKRSIILPIFVFTYSIYALMLTWAIPRILSEAPGHKIFDLMTFGYDAETARAVLSGIGASGRSFYLNTQLPLDILFPLGYMITMALTFTAVRNRFFPQSTYARICITIPILAALFDWAENIAIALMLTHYPSVSNELIQTASVLTLIKSIISIPSVLMLILGILMLTYDMVRNRNKTTA